MENNMPVLSNLTRQQAANIMRRCGTEPADASNCEKCEAHNNCAYFFRKVADLLESSANFVWIPVDVEMPPDDSDVLAFTDDGVESRIVPVNYARGVWFDCIFTRPVFSVTHWAKLPCPPTEDTIHNCGHILHLDCGIGDIVYCIMGEDIVPMEVQYVYINSRNRIRYHAREAVLHRNFRAKAIGKDVFLTMEEAQAALTGGVTE